ncbi:hypothetical protein AAG906_010415 [Vitis piasezkii]
MLHTYSEVVARALVIEREMEEAQRLRSRNSRFGDSEKRERDFKCQKVTHPQQQPIKQEQYSGTTDWAKGTRRCYECGEMGHLRREKAWRTPEQGQQERFYALGSQNDGRQYFLFNMQGEGKKKTTIDCIPMVCEFADVFTKEFPCLPPHRRMDFSIELYPGTNPISIAPYKMATVEVKELNIQLQELQSKGFIWPSTSLWGVLVLFVKKRMDSCGYVWIKEN